MATVDSCRIGGNAENAFTTYSAPLTRSRSPPVAPDPPVINAVSREPFRRSISPDRLSVRSAACRDANPASATFPVQSCTAAAPPLYRMDAAVICSLPKIVPRAAVFCASVIPRSPSLRACIAPSAPMNLPCASNTLIPRLSISVFAAFDGAVRDSSTPRSEVPACSPMTPCLASSARVPTVWSMDMPRELATGPTYLRASDRSVTEPCAFPAPAARRSATCPRSLPWRLN
jgi:hypothetical protein